MVPPEAKPAGAKPACPSEPRRLPTVRYNSGSVLKSSRLVEQASDSDNEVCRASHCEGQSGCWGFLSRQMYNVEPKKIVCRMRSHYVESFDSRGKVRSFNPSNRCNPSNPLPSPAWHFCAYRLATLLRCLLACSARCLYGLVAATYASSPMSRKLARRATRCL